MNCFNGKIYKDDPTIFAWELANEPRAEGDQSGNILNEWITEMSAYIKSIDDNHLVTTGVIGFYNKDGNSDWMRNWDNRLCHSSCLARSLGSGLQSINVEMYLLKIVG